MTKTIEQLSARVAELEAAHAAAVLSDVQLREAVDQYLAENDPSEFGCACDPSVGHLCGPCFAHKQQTVLRKSIATPISTEALDKYVAEKVKESLLMQQNIIDGMSEQIEQIATLTRQRDLAVEALEKIKFSDAVVASTYALNALSAIKESDGK